MLIRLKKNPYFIFIPDQQHIRLQQQDATFNVSTARIMIYHRCQFRENRIIGQDSVPEETLMQAIQYGCESIAYTYTEPTIFYEYAFDVAQLAHERSIKNIFVTNGFITSEALQKIAPYLDAANVDLKSFYKRFL